MAEMVKVVGRVEAAMAKKAAVSEASGCEERCVRTPCGAL